MGGKAIAMGAAAIGAAIVITAGGVILSKGSGGCCMPFCEVTEQEQCEEVNGGTWHKGSCQNIDECKTGCCTPQCVEDTQEMCDQYGGEFNDVTCDEIDECKVSCCLPFCEDYTAVECEQRAGESSGEKCEDIDECKRGCCEGIGSDMLKLECDQMMGKWTEGEECPGFNGHAESTEFIELDWGGNAEYEFAMDVSACEDTVNTEWFGSWSWVWTFDSGEGVPFEEVAAGDFSFIPDASGYFSFSMEGIPVTGTISESSLSASFEMGGVVPVVEASGSVSKGAGSQCWAESAL